MVTEVLAVESEPVKLETRSIAVYGFHSVRRQDAKFRDDPSSGKLVGNELGLRAHNHLKWRF